MIICMKWIQELPEDGYYDDPTETFSSLPVVYSTVCRNVSSRLLVNVIRSAYTSPGLIQLFPTIISEPQTYLTLVHSNTAFRE